jgi:hypothetical protein
LQSPALKLGLVSLLSLAAFCIAACSSRNASASREAGSTVETMSVLLSQREDAMRQLSAQTIAESGAGLADAYLAKIRRDGVAKHSELKRRIDDIAQNTIAIDALIDLHEPYAKTVAFRTEAKKFRAYGLVWIDRWNGVFETFMLGGRLPATEPLYPNGFAAALKAEAEAIK